MFANRYQDKVVPISTAARILHTTSNWLREEAAAGRLPHVEAGRTILFHVPTVQAILVERAKREGVADDE